MRNMAVCMSPRIAYVCRHFTDMSIAGHMAASVDRRTARAHAAARACVTAHAHNNSDVTGSALD